MGALGRWLGRYSGRWFGLASGGPPPPHTVSLAGFSYKPHFGRPRVGDLATGHGGWDVDRREYAPPPHRIRAQSAHAGPTFGKPRVSLRAMPSAAVFAVSFGRLRITARPMPKAMKQLKPPEPVVIVDRYARARREDDEMMME